MKLKTRCLPLVALGLTMASLIGCQTWTYESGMTLPSGHYLEHEPQYIPRSPEFPLPNELARMQEQGAAAASNRPLPNQLVPLPPGQ